MNPSYGYQLYQAQRVRTRAEVLADDMRRGRQAAAVSRAGRGICPQGARCRDGAAQRHRGSGKGLSPRRVKIPGAAITGPG